MNEPVKTNISLQRKVMMKCAIKQNYKFNLHLQFNVKKDITLLKPHPNTCVLTPNQYLL